MAVFAILLSFAATCDKLNLDIGESLMKVLDYPLHNIFDDANTSVQEGGLSHVLGGRPVLPMPVAVSAIPETITIPEASLPVVFSDTTYTVPAVPMMQPQNTTVTAPSYPNESLSEGESTTPPQNTTVTAPSSTESNDTSHKEPTHNADAKTLTPTIEASCVIPTNICPISYYAKPDFVVPYTCVRAIPYGHDDYLQFHHKPPPFV